MNTSDYLETKYPHAQHEHTDSPQDTPLFQKVAPVRIFEQAVEQLRDLIVSGRLKPGDRLPTEQVLCRQLNISRSTVREALRVLEAEGWVEVRRGMGSFIVERPVTILPRSEIGQWLESHRTAIEQVIQVRESIEPSAAELAALNSTPEELHNIQNLVVDLASIIDQIRQRGDEALYSQLAQVDTSFHQAIAEASDNDLMVELISQILPMFYQSDLAVLFVTGRMDMILSEHQAIANAIAAGDAAAARQAMQEHLYQIRRSMENR